MPRLVYWDGCSDDDVVVDPAWVSEGINYFAYNGRPADGGSATRISENAVLLMVADPHRRAKPYRVVLLDSVADGSDAWLVVSFDA